MEMFRGRVPVKQTGWSGTRGQFGILGVWQRCDPPDRPHEQWALSHFEVDSYDKAAKKVQDNNDFEGSELTESFENGIWTISDSYHSGKGKTKDAALIDYAHDECYNYESDW